MKPDDGVDYSKFTLTSPFGYHQASLPYYESKQPVLREVLSLLPAENSAPGFLANWSRTLAATLSRRTVLRSPKSPLSGPIRLDRLGGLVLPAATQRVYRRFYLQIGLFGPTHRSCV